MEEEEEIDQMALMGLEKSKNEAEKENENSSDPTVEQQLQRRVDELEISLLRRDAKTAAESVRSRPCVQCARRYRVLVYDSLRQTVTVTV